MGEFDIRLGNALTLWWVDQDFRGRYIGFWIRLHQHVRRIQKPMANRSLPQRGYPTGG